MLNTGLFEIIVGVLTTCHTQYTWDRSVCIFLFNRTTLQVFVTYLTGALFIHSFSSLYYDRSKASSKASSPHSAIQSLLFQMRVSSPFL